MRNCPKARQDGIIAQATGDELVVYEIATDRASALNETAAAVFQLCDGRRSIDAIAREVGQDREIVRVALDRIARAGLLENADEFRVPRSALPTRRNLLKRAGLTAVAVMPAVITISAPSPAQAFSPNDCFNPLINPATGQPVNCQSAGVVICDSVFGPGNAVCAKPRQPGGGCSGNFVCLPPGCDSYGGFDCGWPGD